MEIKEFMYEGKVVEFFIGDEVMINATEMGFIFGKRVSHFLRLESTKSLICELEKTTFSENRIPNLQTQLSLNAFSSKEVRNRSADLVPILVISKGYEASTLMHRYLAMSFAMWLDVKFHVWILGIMDKLIHGYALAKRNNTIEKKKAQKRIQKNLLDHAANPVVKQLADDMDLLKQIDSKNHVLNRRFLKNILEP